MAEVLQDTFASKLSLSHIEKEDIVSRLVNRNLLAVVEDSIFSKLNGMDILNLCLAGNKAFLNRDDWQTSEVLDSSQAFNVILNGKRSMLTEMKQELALNDMELDNLAWLIARADYSCLLRNTSSHKKTGAHETFTLLFEEGDIPWNVEEFFASDKYIAAILQAGEYFWENGINMNPSLIKLYDRRTLRPINSAGFSRINPDDLFLPRRGSDDTRVLIHHGRGERVPSTGNIRKVFFLTVWDALGTGKVDTFKLADNVQGGEHYMRSGNMFIHTFEEQAYSDPSSRLTAAVWKLTVDNRVELLNYTLLELEKPDEEGRAQIVDGNQFFGVFFLSSKDKCFQLLRNCCQLRSKEDFSLVKTVTIASSSPFMRLALGNTFLGGGIGRLVDLIHVIGDSFILVENRETEAIEVRSIADFELVLSVFNIEIFTNANLEWPPKFVRVEDGYFIMVLFNGKMAYWKLPATVDELQQQIAAGRAVRYLKSTMPLVHGSTRFHFDQARADDHGVLYRYSIEEYAEKVTVEIVNAESSRL